jgi:hypothetical protein
MLTDPGQFGLFTVDRSNPNRLYAWRSTGPVGGRIVFSNDGGTTWSTDSILDGYLTDGGFIRNFAPTLLAFDPENSNIIVAGGSDSGVFVSIDAGASWRLVTDPIDAGKSGIPHLPRPRYAYFDHEPVGTSKVYIGTQGRGVWRINLDFNLAPDQFEPNNTQATATSLGSEPSINLTGLTIDNPTDVDFFKYTASVTGKLIVNTTFDNLTGHLDLRVRDRNGNIIANGVLSNLVPGTLDRQQFIIPVVAQQDYYIEVFSSVGHTNTYSLEIENFPAPVPEAPVLSPADDSGMSNLDNVTFKTTPTVNIQADLTDFFNMGIAVLTAGQAAGGLTAGAAVQVFVNGVAKGFAGPVGASTTQFQFTMPSGALGSDGLKFVTAAVRIFDGQRNTAGSAAPASGRTQQSEPLLLTLDTTPPDPPSAPDLLDSSDSGMSGTDNKTNVSQPAFKGTGEANAKIYIFANGELVGQGVIGSDNTDGVPGDGKGAWEVTVEPLVDGTYTITAKAEDLAGNLSAASSPMAGGDLMVDTQAPQRPTIDLLDSSDSGRNNQDNITNDTTPTVRVTAEPGTMVVIKDGNTVIDTFTSTGTDDRTLPVLAEGQHPLSAEATDKAGNRSVQSEELDVTIDTTPPALPTILLDPRLSDTGVAGYPATLTDHITSDTATGFAGAAEADALVRLFANGVADGQTVAVPLDGNRAFPGGEWRLPGLYDLNNSAFFPFDGLRTMTATAEDLAGNVSDVGRLNIFVDTQGPQVTNVFITNRPAFDLFDPKPSTNGPTPRIDSLTIALRDLPNRVAGFLYEAIHQGVASQPGLYVLKGDQNGLIPVAQVVITNAPRIAGQPATATVELQFSAPLPDDRYTLTIADTLVDDAGNALDGDNNAAQPLETPSFPSGDGQPGGAFKARFTVDSRPEVGTYVNGVAYVDINGNATFDPTGEDNDQTNRDLAFVFGTRTDLLFAGNFAAAGATSASGFDKLGAFGQVGGSSGPFRFLLDFNSDGVFDLNVTSLVNGNGAVPIAGNFSTVHPGDEVGLFNGQKWFLDSNGNNILGDAGDTTLNGNMQGAPIVGDFDGDGKDDLATYKNGAFSFDLASNGLTGNADATITTFGFFGPFEAPVAADLNLDGVDDIGLFVPERNGPPPSEVGQWFFLVSTGAPVTGTVNTLNHLYTPVPFGNDQFVQFGDQLSLPLLGNFDPPPGLSAGADAPPALPPTVLVGPDQQLGGGGALSTSGSFADFGSTAWTATVNYGDGPGEQPLALQPDRSFALAHSYTQAGSYAVTVRVTDETGQVGVGGLVVTVAPPPVAPPPVVVPPPTVANVVVNDGSAQRAQVTRLTITFSGAVTLGPGAFRLVQTVRVRGHVRSRSVRSRAVPVKVSTALVDGRTVAVLTFAGRGVVNGALPDGRYALTVAGPSIRDGLGQALDGNGDGVAGGDTVVSFFRWAGDHNGDGRADRVPWRRARR